MHGVNTLARVPLWRRLARMRVRVRVRVGILFATTALMLTAGGCASIDPYNIIGRRMPFAPVDQSANANANATTPALRAAAIEAVWATVNDHYYRADLNGVDWRAVRSQWQPLALAAPTEDEFWERLDQMAGELSDVHTRVESPKAVAQRNEQQVLSLGLTIRALDGALLVLSVHPESDAYWSGVRTGMRLTRIDGKDAPVQWHAWALAARKTSSAQAALRMPMRRLNVVAAEAIRDSASAAFGLSFARPDGSELDVRLRPKTLSTRPIITSRILPSGVGYVRFTSFQESLRGGVLAAIDAMKDTPALVLDLRGNGGGSGAMAEAIVGSFMRTKTVIGRTETRSGKPVTLAFGAIKITSLEASVPGKPDAYAGKLAVLIDADSASASEATAAALQSTGRAVVVGEVSCGCLLGFLGYATLPGGGELAFSEIGFTTAKGERIEGRGVIPDVAVARSRADFVEQRDRALEAAQAALSK